MIYFVQANKLKLIKIGRTNATNLIERLKMMQIGSPDRLTILATIDNDFDYGGESKIHKKFKYLKEYGEWYRPEKELLDFIETLGKPVIREQLVPRNKERNT